MASVVPNAVYSSFVTTVQDMENSMSCGICMEQFNLENNYPYYTADECQFYVCKKCVTSLPYIYKQCGEAKCAQCKQDKTCVMCRTPTLYTPFTPKMAKYLVNISESIDKINQFGIEHSNCGDVKKQLSELVLYKGEEGIVANGIQNITGIVTKILIDANQMEAKIKKEVNTVQTKLHQQQEIQDKREKDLLSKEQFITQKIIELTTREDKVNDIEDKKKQYEIEIKDIEDEKKQYAVERKAIECRSKAITERESFLNSYQQTLDARENSISIAEKEFEAKQQTQSDIQQVLEQEMKTVAQDKLYNENLTVTLAIQQQEFEMKKQQFDKIYNQIVDGLKSAVNMSDTSLRKSVESIIKIISDSEASKKSQQPPLPNVTTSANSDSSSKTIKLTQIPFKVTSGGSTSSSKPSNINMPQKWFPFVTVQRKCDDVFDDDIEDLY